MTDESEPLQPIIMYEVPDECDTCQSTGTKNPILQTSKAWYGTKKLVVGYMCDDCGTQHLYR